MSSRSKGFWISLALIAVLTFIAVVYRVLSEIAGPRLDAGLNKSEDDAKSKLPMKIDENTTLVDLKYEPTKTTYWYVIDDDRSFDPREVQRVVLNQACADSKVSRAMREKGFTYEYRYMNKARASLGTFIIARCPW
jgi:hypothetical protein